jgi:hypothetical protein
MSQKRGNETTIACRVARRRFTALLASAKDARVVPIRQALSLSERDATERHLQTCQGCATDFRLLALSRAAMDAAAASAPMTPGEDFFKAVRARLHRGEAPTARVDESWAAVLLITARQLIPVMALLLLLIISATFLWSRVLPKPNPALQGRAALPRLYDDPAPSADEALDNFMAIEEKENGD